MSPDVCEKKLIKQTNQFITDANLPRWKFTVSFVGGAYTAHGSNQRLLS